MLSMSVCLIQNPQLRLCGVRVVGGASESIFPAVDALLEDRQYQKAIVFAVRKKEVRRYRSFVDFLYCELFNDWVRCFQYYEGDGPPFRDLIDEPRCRQIESQLIDALHLAHKLFADKEIMSWDAFRIRCHKNRH